MRTVKIAVIAMVLTLWAGHVHSQNDFKLYNEARKLTHEKKWNEAIKSCDEIFKKFPDSRYTDDAHFWKAYALEKEEKWETAFDAYKELIRKFPQSPWVDDALIHQIVIAERFYNQGFKESLTFLKSALDHPDKDVRYQAAISLGKLGEKAAIPTLKEIANNGDEDLQIVAKRLLTKIESLPEAQTGDHTDIEVLQNAKSQGGLSDKESESKWDGLFFKSNRYQQYIELNKKGADWTELELIRYGLWHILPEGPFTDFFQLTNEFDQKEWLRKFWKKWDPTPTTPENERKDEFMQRIKYAHENFGEEWNGWQTEYLTSQYLRPGWTMAPWDCRGEMYIKYGEPDFRDRNFAFKKELWSYYRDNFDVILHDHMTNIFGNAIKPGPLSRITYKWSIGQFDSDIAFKKEFRYNVYQSVHPMKNFKLSIDIPESDSTLKDVHISYLVSGDELKFNKIDGKYRAKYLQRYTVLNEDLNEVTSGEKEYVLITDSKSDTKGKHNFKSDIDLQLSPGYYTLAIRIEDVNSDRLGIFLQDLNVQQ
ncbi:GWxTD domain-containing protein [candidate division KSB1 bacterium]|nr:GWxTD domain-containing protein [candidate division KSB1 bacterium]